MNLQRLEWKQKCLEKRISCDDLWTIKFCQNIQRGELTCSSEKNKFSLSVISCNVIQMKQLSKIFIKEAYFSYQTEVCEFCFVVTFFLNILSLHCVFCILVCLLLKELLCRSEASVCKVCKPKWGNEKITDLIIIFSSPNSQLRELLQSNNIFFQLP